MCRSFPRVLQGLSIRVHSLEASQKVRHTSLIPESVPVARTRSLAPIHNAHHAAHRPLRFSYSSSKIVAHPLNRSRSAPSRAYSQDLGREPRHRQEDMARATETPGPEAKPVDILDEDIPVDPEELREALGRPPPVNSSYLPLPWKGRLGYVGYAVLDTIYPADDPPILTWIGLFKYVPPLFNTLRILFSNMSNRLHTRKSTPAPRPRPAHTPDQEPSRPGPTSRRCTRTSLRRGAGLGECTRFDQNHSLERQIWH
jgi:hypothetical protein